MAQAEMICSKGGGEALVSFLDEKWSPQVVGREIIRGVLGSIMGGRRR